VSYDEFYYREDVIIYFTGREKKVSKHDSHIHVEDYEEEEKGSKRAGIYEERSKDSLTYYIELPGVISPDDIEILLEENELLVKARLRKVIIYPGLRKDVKVSEYKARVELPFSVSPDDIETEFDTSKGLLIIRIKREKKRYRRIRIDKVY